MTQHSTRRLPVSPNAVGALAVAATLGVGLLAYPFVPDQFTVRWTVGAYYGPEALPKAIGLLVVPVLSAGVYGLLRALPAFDGFPNDLARSRAYRLAVAGVLASLFLTQLLLIGLNAAGF
jgi:hypothetical protein